MSAVYKNVSQIRKLLELSFGYARFLKFADLPVLQAVCESCSDVSTLLSGVPPGKDSAAQIFAETTGRRADGSEGFCVGIFDWQDQMIGVMALRRDDPVVNDWYIGNFMLVPEVRSRGYGAEVVTAFTQYVRDMDCERILLAVMWVNDDGMRFWLDNGFEPLRPVEPTRFGHMMQTGIELVRFVQGNPA